MKGKTVVAVVLKNEIANDII